MRVYPSDDYDKEELERLNAEPWMVELLKCNPGYPFWGNYEDYMIKDSGWDARAEVEDVSQLWELDDLNEVVNFYFEICRENHKCEDCECSGYNPETKQISDDWYDFANTGRRWCENITQDEVDALWEHNRLHCDFKEKPTAEQVNAWAKGRSGHDSINHYICVEQRAKRLGVYGHCEKCGGYGYIFDEDKAHLELQLWVLHPRKDCSRGVRVKNVLQSDIPKVIEYLQTARKRNDDRFSKINGLSFGEVRKQKFGGIMKNHIELSRDEIKKIIAEHFSVSEDKVAVAVEPKSVGYGTGEHYQYVPYAVVEKVD